MNKPRPSGGSRVAVIGLTFVATLVSPLRASTANGAAAPTRSFEVVASKFKFEPSVLEVDEGDRVVITFTSADVKHGFELKPFKVKARIPAGGEPVTVEFVADKAGTFRFKCSEYCGPRHGGMRGQLVVRPRAQ